MTLLGGESGESGVAPAEPDVKSLQRTIPRFENAFLRSLHWRIMEGRAQSCRSRTLL